MSFRQPLRPNEPAPHPPLPADRIDPRIPVDQLVAHAQVQGAADARAGVLDAWSFGGPDAPISAEFDPPYVNQLWDWCAAAEAAIHARRAITGQRTGHLRRLRDDAVGFMASARAAMTGLAAREARLRDVDAAPRDRRFDPADVPAVEADDQVWEGESHPLGGRWRLLLVLGLIAAELPVQYVCYDRLLAESPGLLILLSLSSALLVVLGPYLAAFLLRARQATGADRRIAWVVPALAAPWLFVTVVLGLFRGSLLAEDRTTTWHLTEPTVVAMFVGLLLVIGAMGFMLGLARRHPFQEAHVRHRLAAEQLDAARQQLIDRLDHAFVESDGDGPDDPAEAEIQAVRAAYATAEDAYFTALTTAMGDPSFTEAVQHRRGPRRHAPMEAPAAESPAS